MPPAVIELIKLLGPMGFIMYLVWKFQHHTIPRLASENHAAQKQQREDFKDILKQQLQKFDEMQRTQQEFFQRIIEREQSVHENQTREIVSAVKDLAAEIHGRGQHGSS